MKLNRIGRIVVCLLLICCILVNLSPLKAKAVTPGMVAVGTVSALVLIPALLYGLGVMQGTDSATFNQVVSDCNDFLTDAGYIVAGAATMLSLTQDGATITYAHRNMIQDIFEWLWDSGTISGPAYSLTLEGHSITCDAPINYFVAQNWDYSMKKYKRFIYIFSTAAPYVDGSHNGNTAGPIDGVYYPWSSIFLGYYDYDSTIFEGGVENYITQFGYDISPVVLDGLVAGQIAEQDTDIETGYETYIQEGIVSIDFGIQFEEGSPYDPDGDDQKYHHWLPFKVPSPDNLSNLTQEDAWSGESEVELEYKTDTDTGTDSSNGSDTGTESGNQTDYTSWFERIIKGIEELPSKFESWISDCKTAIEALPSKFADWFNSIIEKLSSIWETLKSIPQTILDGLRNILTELFVPQEDYISDKVTSLRERFSFADSIMETGRAIGDSLSFGDSEPPVIYIHLGDTEGSYNIGGTVPFLDMRWYARYKPTGDVLLSSLIWVFFAWRCFVHAPNIISGIAGDVEAFNIPDGGGMYLSGSPYAGSDFEKPKRGKFERRKNGRR